MYYITLNKNEMANNYHHAFHFLYKMRLNIFLFQIHKFLDMFMNLTKEGKEKLYICPSIFTKKKKPIAQ